MVRKYGELFTLNYQSDCGTTGGLPNLEIAIFGIHKILILQYLTCKKLTFQDGMQNAEFLDFPCIETVEILTLLKHTKN